MIGILAVKQSYTSSIIVPLLFITGIFTIVCRGIFSRPFTVMSLRGAVDLDKHEEVCSLLSLLHDVHMRSRILIHLLLKECMRSVHVCTLMC